MQIHVTRGQQQMGIYPVEQVRQMLTSGYLQPTDLGWYEGLPTWVPLSQLPVLSKSAPPLPATAPPLGGGPQQTCGMATGSLVCGIAGLFCLFVRYPCGYFGALGAVAH